MALVRLDIPSLMLYGGSIAPGRWHGRDVTILDVFEAVGAHAAGEISDEELRELEDVASPGAGACGGQFTANTMACAFEALGISPGGSAMVPAEDDEKVHRRRADRRAGDAGAGRGPAARAGSSPGSRSRTRSPASAPRAARPTASSTCSPSPARPGSSSTSTTSSAISRRTPLLADLKPGGRFVATDLYRAGGVPLILNRLAEAGILHTDALTVTGETIGEVAAGRHRGARPGGRATALRSRSRARAAWRSCAATSPPRARW